jgi:hypothetical protein
MQVIWIISTHTGEIDYILPLLIHLKKKKIKIKAIFFNLKVYENFKKSNFYKKCFSEFGVEYVNIGFFDTRLIYLIFNILILIWKAPLILYNLYKSKFVFFEKSFSTKSSKFISFFCNILKKKTLLYPHAVAVYSYSKPQDFANIFKYHLVLLSHKLEKNHYTKKLNFLNYVLIGHPYLSSEWKNFIFKNFYNKIYKKKIISIILGKIYGEKKLLYQELSKILMALNNKNKDMEIRIKIHPSLSLEKIKKDINEFSDKIIRVEFTHDHIAECSINSDLVIIFNNSSSWVPALLGCPYIEYCTTEYLKSLRLNKTPINNIDDNSFYKIKDIKKKILEYNFDIQDQNSNFTKYKFKKNIFISIFEKH